MGRDRDLIQKKKSWVPSWDGWRTSADTILQRVDNLLLATLTAVRLDHQNLRASALLTRLVAARDELRGNKGSVSVGRRAVHIVVNALKDYVPRNCRWPLLFFSLLLADPACSRSGVWTS